MRKPCIALIFLFSGFTITQAQINNTDKEVTKPSFVLYYAIAGMGSNTGTMQPTFNLEGTKFTYSYKQNSAYGQITRKPQFICSGMFRSSSIDSIINLVSTLKDTTIWDSNPCIMSGVVYIITVSTGKQIVNYRMKNTIDETTLQIAEIINTYLPPGKKITVSRDLITQAKDCKEELRSRSKKKEKTKRAF